MKQCTSKNSTLTHINGMYHLFLNMFEEIQKHKWIESEKKGYDIGFEAALTDWIKKHRKDWINNKH